jgi:GrpB-like predicted nucleotidyltransferase (UPF0157 family)
MGDAVLGLARGYVHLVPHDPRWDVLFDLAAAELSSYLDLPRAAIEHIGSTAVPDLAAKPVLDILVAVPSLLLPRSLFVDLERMGYQHRATDTVPERLFFAKGEENCRTHNLSVCETDSAFWRDRIRFRDLLRADPELRTRYATLKRELATRFPYDRFTYTEAKGEFIAGALGPGSKWLVVSN